MVTETIIKPIVVWREDEKGDCCLQLIKLKIIKPKRLLIDLDGTIVEYNFPLLVKNFFGVDISKYQIYAYDLADVLGVAPALIDKMFREQVFGKANFIDGALETLQGWENKYEIIIYSNRVKYMGYEGLMDWLIDNQIPFSGIDGGQGVYDLHIDDRPAKLMETNSKVKLLFNQPWNAGCHNVEGKLKRVFTWDEIRREVDG